MSFAIQFTRAASIDVEELYQYWERNTVKGRAKKVLATLEETILSLEDEPTRGTIVKELQLIGINDYREIYFKPYRIIYKIVGQVVYVMVVADGRRDFQTLLQRRLLQG